MNRIICLKPWPLASFSLAILLSVWLAPIRADWKEDNQAVEDVKKLLQTTDKAPEVLLTQARQALQNSSNRPLWVQAGLYGEIARFQRDKQKDVKASIATLDEGITKFVNAPERFNLVGDKAQILADTDVDAAEAFLKEQWPAVQKEDPKYLYWITFPYVRVLRAQAKDEEAVKLLTTMCQDNLRVLAGYPGDWMTGELVKLLSSSGQNEAALRWAKLNWMLAPFEEKALAETTKQLVRAWSTTDVDGTSSDAFVKAQADATLKNPLKDVPLPTFSPELIQAQLSKANSEHFDRKFAVLIAAGEWRKAMLAARALMLEKPESTDGVMQVCRIFKAADLNLVRANAFVEWVKKPQGPNPIVAFLQEHPNPAAP